MQKFLQDVHIEKIGYGGIGIATAADGKKILVKWGALPWSVVDCRIVKKRKDFIQAHIITIKSYDPQWADGEIFCPHYFIPLGASKDNEQSHKIGCWGCKWQIMSYGKQLEAKQDLVRDCMRKFDAIDIRPIIPSPLQTGYRNKIEFSFGKYISAREDIHTDRNLGFHKQGEFSKIVDVDSCGLIGKEANTLYDYIKKICQESGLATYDQKIHQWIFRHLVIREGVNTEQFLVHLVIADKEFNDDSRALRLQLQERIQQDTYLKKIVDTWIVSYNNGLADIIRTADTRTETRRGEGTIYEKLIFPGDNEQTRELNFRISPFSFFQTNTVWAQQLFYHAAQLAGHVTWDILDMYCGAGSIGLSFLAMGIGNKVIGVEIVNEAITDAWHNAKINGLEDNAMFFVWTSEKLFIDYPQLAEKMQSVWLVIVDPPRDGLHKNVIDFLIQMKKNNGSKIIYISCNPVTMARDLELLAQADIHCKTLIPVDMFPHTHHIEVIWLL
jgi:23S rRNA (uracil1939-C5)-methyltransferase